MTTTGTLPPLRVLIAEESPTVAERLRVLIDESGPATVVVEARSADEALALFHRRKPDVVILDPQLADGSGYTVLREIKHARTDCIVIVLTHYVTREYRELCHALGADHFFVKATEFERAINVLMDLCRGRTDSAPSAPAPDPSGPGA